MRSLFFFCTLLMICACASREVSISGERRPGIIESQKYECTGTEIAVISEGRGFTALAKLVRVTLGQGADRQRVSQAAPWLSIA